MADTLDAQKPVKGTDITAKKSQDCLTEELPPDRLDANDLPTTGCDSEKTKPSSQENIKNTAASLSDATVKPVSKKIKIGKGSQKSKKNALVTKRKKEPVKNTKFQIDSDEAVNESSDAALEHRGGNYTVNNAESDPIIVVEPDDRNGKPLLNSLSKLELKLANKMNENHGKIDTIMCNLDKLITTVDDLKQRCTSVDGANRTDANALKGDRGAESQTKGAEDAKKNVVCGNDRCVCNLIGEKKIGKKKSEKVNGDDFLLSQFLKCLGEKVNECSSKNNDKNYVGTATAAAAVPGSSSREPNVRYRDKTTQCPTVIDERKKSNASNSFPEPTKRFCGQDKEDLALKKRDKTTQYSLVNVAKNTSDVANGFPKPIKQTDRQGRAEKSKDKENPCSTLVDDKSLKNYTPRYLKECGCFSNEKDDDNSKSNNSTFISNCIAAHQCNFPKFT